MECGQGRVTKYIVGGVVFARGIHVFLMSVLYLMVYMYVLLDIMVKALLYKAGCVSDCLRNINDVISSHSPSM